MKGVLPECKELSISEIMNAISEKIEVRNTPVHPGEAILGDSNEDIIPNEGTTRYDIRFHAHIPHTDNTIKILINVEAQQDYTPGYDIVTRGIYYGARMISSQYGVEFKDSEYNNIKKVYSLWICTDAPNYAKNTITEYKIHQEKVFGDFQGNPRYDILNVTFLCLGNSNETEIPDFLSMLSIALGNHIKVEEKKRRLEREFGIPMTVELEKEINEMCNLADAIERQGIEQGREQNALDNAKKLFENGASYELVRASIDVLSDDRLHQIYEEIMKKKENK